MLIAYFFTKYIVISEISMSNWRMFLANLEQVVLKEKGKTNKKISESKSVQ